MHITPKQIETAFETASRVYDGQLTPTNAAKELHEKYGLNISSARDFIVQYSCLMRGEIFKRTISAPAMEYFLSQIVQQRGRAALDTALVAAWKHVEYYEGIQSVRLGKFRSVLDSFQANLAEPILLNIYESSLDAAVTDSLRDSSAARKKRLQRASKIPKQLVAITKVYSRNPDVIAEVVVRANGLCELCRKPAPFIKKSNGKPYLEAHHKVQLANGGEDSVENAIAICPNCHRKQHFG